MRYTGLTVAVVVLALAASAPAQAAVIPGKLIAGPNAAITGKPVLAIAPDGSGAVAWQQIDGTAFRVWVSRRVGGVWGAPEQLTASPDVSAAGLNVGAGNGGKVIVAFRGGTNLNDAAFRYAPGAGQPFGALDDIRQSDAEAVALGTNAAGVSYALVKTVQNLFAYRIVGGTVSPVGAPDAVDTNSTSGDLITTGSIAVDAAGNAVAAWVQDPAPRTAIARRITGTTLAAAAVVASPSALGGFPNAAGGADTPGVKSDEAGRAWVSFTDDFDYGGGNTSSRAVARRLVGNAFEAPLRFDDLPAVPPADRHAYFPILAVTPAGTRALGASEVDLGAAGGAPFAGTGATIVPGSSTTFTLTAPSPSEDVFPSVAVVPRGAGLFGYAIEPAESSQPSLQARVQLQAGGVSPTPLTLSDPARGPVNLDTPSAAADGTDAASVAYRQGATNMSIHVATVDLPRLPGASALADKTAPGVTRFGLSRRRFRKGTKLPKRSAVKTGTTIRFRLSEDASVRLSFERKRKGRRVGRRCRRPTRRNRNRRRCTRYVRVRTAIRVNGKAGANRVRFQGRLTRRRSLAPGSYRLTLVATDAAKNVSKRRRTSFKLLKAAKKKRRR